MMASQGCSISGSGTVSHRMSCFPCQRSALIPSSPSMRDRHTRSGERHLSLSQSGDYFWRIDVFRAGLQKILSADAAAALEVDRGKSMLSPTGARGAAPFLRDRQRARMATGGSKKVIYAALAGNLAIAATKFGASLWTGSSAMMSEAVHSTVDTGNQGLLLYGINRAARPPSRQHPFGHGMELYFWAFVVALLIFALGGAVSIYEGVRKIQSPEPIEDAWINFLVLGASIVFESLSFRVALREIRESDPNRKL